MDRIPKLIEQYQTENAKLEKDLPTLRQIVGGTWKKEDELKELKSEVATLERKIQLTLPLSGQQTSQTSDEEKIASITKNSILTINENTERFTKQNLRTFQPVYSSENKEHPKGIKL